MTPTTTATGATGATGTSTSPAPARRRRTGVLLAVLAVVLLVVVSVLGGDTEEVEGALDPRNPGPDGAQALARVLDDRGVDVEVARGQEAFLASEVDDATTVVVTNPAALGEETFSALEDHTAGDSQLVLVGDPLDLAAVDALAAPDPGLLPAGDLAARCDDPLVDDLVVRTYDDVGLLADGCFGDGPVALTHEGDQWLLATPESLSNARVTDADNAALGLRLLGQGDRLVWYVADPTDEAPDDGVDLGSLLPRWLGPGAALLVVAGLAALLWRGRRLGPLVTEPLPVAVRAAESTHSRGRLYRRTGDRAHAAEILRQATRRRLAAALRLPAAPTGSPAPLIAAAAARTGRDPRTVHDLVAGPPVADDAGLVELARGLTELEDEVRRQ